MHASNDDSEVTGWLGEVFKDNPKVFESQVGLNPNREAKSYSKQGLEQSDFYRNRSDIYTR